MRQFVRRLAIAAMAAGVLCFVGGGAFAKDPVRPMRGQSEGTIVFGGCPGGDLQVEEGNATHLGLYEAATCGFLIGGAPPILMVAGYGTVTAANGDQINVRFIGTLDISGDPWVTNVTVTAVSGTGRFANVSGQFQYVSLRPGGGPSYTSSFSGVIAY